MLGAIAAIRRSAWGTHRTRPELKRVRNPSCGRRALWHQLDLRAIRQACRRRHDHALATAQPVDDLDVRPVVSPGLYYYEVNARAVVDDGDVYPRRVIDHSARGNTHDRMRYGDPKDDVSVHAGTEFAGRILHLDLGG